jgi:prepilin-type N-terminal cleavage/methylation domain-containing protein
MRSRRKGYTLIEISVVATILSVMVLLTATTMHAMYSGSRRLRNQANVRSAMASLALQMRRDLHVSREASLREDELGNAAGLNLELPEGAQVTYETMEAGITRLEKQGGEVLHRDLYRLKTNRHKLNWSVSAGTPPRVVVEVSPVNADASLGVIGAGTLRVEAIVGLTSQSFRLNERDEEDAP